MSKNLFIVGTGTDVGKTYITALIIQKIHESGHRAAYYKAAMSGNVRREDGTLLPGDAAYVQRISGISQPLHTMCPYVYERAWSPHLAARHEGNPVDLGVVRRGFEALQNQYEYITLEGSGGIVCPIRYDGQTLFLQDIIRALHVPCVLVADAGLGTINSVVLTHAYMQAQQLPVHGLIFNRFHPADPMHQDNIHMCTRLTGLPVLATVEEGATRLDLDIHTLLSVYE